MFYNLAKKLRASKVLRHITPQDYHLDIGTGDGYILLRSPAHIKMGIAHSAERLLPKLDDHYTRITMVAVIEHLNDIPGVVRECLRLLAPGGKLIITTPTVFGFALTPIVDIDAFFEHKRFVTYSYLRKIVPKKYKITRRFFEFGLNQIFIVEAK